MTVLRALVLAGSVALAACSSPEATRLRAGGPGADVGNHPRDPVLRMHEGSRPFWNTPRVTGVAGPSLDEASQADRLSR